jgi:iron complex transport system permease protein
MAAIDVTQRPGKPGHVTVRRGNLFALRFNYRVLGYTGIALIVLAALAIWAMTLGSYRIPFVDVAKAVVGRGGEDQLFIVRDLRLPRVVCAMLIGAALAMSGAIFQGLIRNPLISPDIIGINSGAGLVAMFWIVTGMGASTLSIGAFLGAIVTASIIYVLAWRGGINPNRLILVGIGIGSVISAGTTFISVRYPIEQVRPAMVWAMGSIYGSDWGDVKTLGIFLGICLPLALALVWPLRVLQLGDDVTRILGLPLERIRLALIVVGCALAAVAVAIAGPIGFVALMIPHVARMMVGPLSGSVLVFTGVIGAIFLLFADVVGQHFLPVTLPVGVVTSAIGAPYFLFLLYRANARM